MHKVKIDPVVVFHILDHYVRRNANQENVIGALLGCKYGDSLEVRHVIPVPHTEGDDSLSIDVEFQRVMYDLHLKVDPKNVIVGWYSTFFSDHSQPMHDFYSKKLGNPIHIIVDPRLQGESLHIKVLTTQKLTVAGKQIGPVFREIPFEWKTGEAETLALNLMTTPAHQALKDPDEQEVSARSPLAALQLTSAKVLLQLTKAYDYVSKVLCAELKEDKAVGRALFSVVAQLPTINPATFDKVFNDSLQDMLMVIYLGKLMKTQLALTEKLHGTLPPTAYF